MSFVKVNRKNTDFYKFLAEFLAQKNRPDPKAIFFSFGRHRFFPLLMRKFCCICAFVQQTVDRESREICRAGALFYIVSLPRQQKKKPRARLVRRKVREAPPQRGQKANAPHIVRCASVCGSLPLELLTRFELVTSSLPRTCSTT